MRSPLSMNSLNIRAILEIEYQSDAEMDRLKLQERANLRRTDSHKAMVKTGNPDKVFNLENRIITLTNETQIEVRIYWPIVSNTECSVSAILFVHGGGWVHGDLDTHDVLARCSANETGSLVMAVHYRRAPESMFPAAVDDVFGALKWLHDHDDESNVDNKKIMMVGDSCGGNLVAVVSAMARDNHGPHIRGQWSLYPVSNLDLDTPSFGEFGQSHVPTKESMMFSISCYIPQDLKCTDPRVSPDDADKSNSPPTLITVGTHDTLRSGCESYHEKLLAAGVKSRLSVYQNALHAFVQFYKDSETHPLGREALKEGVDFLTDCSAGCDNLTS